jgi:hypothetical protein
MFKISISLLVITSLLSASCSSTRKSLALGLGTGAATGATIGAMSSRNQSQGALTGLALGAIVGGIASYFIHGGLEDRDKETRKETLFNLEKHGVFGEQEQKPEESRWTNRIWPGDRSGGYDR